MTCIFCKIQQGEIPAEIIYRDDKVLAFRDIQPQAEHHLVIIPLEHIATLNELTNDHTQLIGQMVQTATKLAKELNIAEDGYRLVMNCNANGGQTVFHIHLHLLGGRLMHWPPG